MLFNLMLQKEVIQIHLQNQYSTIKTTKGSIILQLTISLFKSNKLCLFLITFFKKRKSVNFLSTQEGYTKNVH